MQYTIITNSKIILNCEERMELRINTWAGYGDFNNLKLGETMLLETNVSVNHNNPQWHRAMKQLIRIMSLIADDLAKGKTIIDVRKYQNWKYVRKDY